MATVPRDAPYFWVTWLTGLLAGEAQCTYAAWFKGHHKYDKRPSDLNLAAWQVEHTALVRRTVDQLIAEGWTVTIEHQNAFRLKGKTAILSGKPDVIARKGPRVLVLDCKTGQPTSKDWVQVCVYLLAIPLAWQRPTLVVEGELVYQTHRVSVSLEDATLRVRDRLFALLRQLGTGPQPATVPSQRECEWCDIAACPDRWTGDGTPAETLTAVF